jgi:hypothetical protein
MVWSYKAFITKFLSLITNESVNKVSLVGWIVFRLDGYILVWVWCMWQDEWRVRSDSVGESVEVVVWYSVDFRMLVLILSR